MGIKDNKDKMRVELDWSFIEEMAQRMNANKDKYPRDNWKQSIDVVELEDAMMRHWFDYKRGDDKENHLAAIALNAMMIAYQKKNSLSKNPPDENFDLLKLKEEMRKMTDINKNLKVSPSQHPRPFKNQLTCTEEYKDWRDKHKGGFLYSAENEEYIGAPGGNNNFVKSAPVGVWVDPPSGWKYGFPKEAPYPLPDNMIEWVIDQGYPRAEVESLGEHFYIGYTEVYE